ncbi:EVE domain-containing protein [Marinomonas ostreistagni]|uniref:EVE domain-containing protein n=1 Tax=Marinomonas ostreistagni TaxID=359209 RepID=UPI00194FEBF8|nr:EVE domain-containing protein [Marinomonas ostreistagni]MBM6549695.1 EVE domain-containing protein [Marinomonas ostreistagni]
MNVWLMKSEPDEFSIQDLYRKGRENWDGVRNFQARNYMREMALGDLVLFYHSSCKTPGIVGTATVSKTAHPDPSCYNPESPYYDAKSSANKPRWDQVELTFESMCQDTISLRYLKSLPTMADFELITRSRLSVMPVKPPYWQVLEPLVRQTRDL